MPSSYKKKRMQAGLRKTQFVALQALPYYDEILAKIKGGIPCSQIAAWIQLVKKDHTSKKRSALQKQLERLRANVAPKDIVDKHLLKAKEMEMDEMVSIVKESQWLMKLNKGRIRKNQRTEQMAPISFPSQDKAIQLHLELIEMNKAMLQDLGMLTRVGQEESGPVTTIGSIGTVNINNMSIEELSDYEQKLAEDISKRVGRISSLRAKVGKGRIGDADGTGETQGGGGETVSSEEPPVSDTTSND